LKADRQQKSTQAAGLDAAVLFGYAVFLEGGAFHDSLVCKFLKITTLAHSGYHFGAESGYEAGALRIVYDGPKFGDPSF
jgi:hypothetical protein